jgi:hypothetical protein
MMRQNVEIMIAEGFALIDSNEFDSNALIVVPTSFGKLGELDGMQEDWDERDTISAQGDILRGNSCIPAAKSVR